MFRRLLVTSLFLAAVSACKTNNVPTTPTGDNTVRFTVAMTAAQEVPPITGPEAGASGNATITFNLTRNAAGTITSATADFTVTLTGFPAGTAINSAHIHPGFANSIGGVTVNTGVVAGDITLATGSGGFTRSVTGIGADVAAGIVANPQGFYFNVHSALNPGGAVRGQLVKQ